MYIELDKIEGRDVLRHRVCLLEAGQSSPVAVALKHGEEFYIYHQWAPDSLRASLQARALRDQNPSTDFRDGIDVSADDRPRVQAMGAAVWKRSDDMTPRQIVKQILRGWQYG